MRTELLLFLCALARGAAAAVNPKKHLRVQQVWGIEEPASTAFSALGVAAAGVALLRHRAARRSLPAAWAAYPYRATWHACLWSVALSSLCSVLFHAHETRAREVADYLVAIAQLFLYAASCAVRVCALRKPCAQAGVFALAALGTGVQAWYMLCVKFDYGWHVRLGAYLAAGFVLAWSAWAVLQIARRGSNNRRSAAMWLLASTGSLVVFAPLELRDFRPLWGVFDAHSLWHASLVVMATLFWEFCIHDFLSFAPPLKIN